MTLILIIVGCTIIILLSAAFSFRHFISLSLFGLFAIVKGVLRPCGQERRHNTLVLGNLAKRFKLIGHDGLSCLLVHVSFIILLMQESCVTHVLPNNLPFIFESNINISPPPYLVFTLSLRRRIASFHCSFQVIVLPIITSHVFF